MWADFRLGGANSDRTLNSLLSMVSHYFSADCKEKVYY